MADLKPALDSLKRKRSQSVASPATSNGKALIPRKYQQEVFEMAKEKNVIAVMDTVSFHIQVVKSSCSSIQTASFRFECLRPTFSRT